MDSFIFCVEILVGVVKKHFYLRLRQNGILFKNGCIRPEYTSQYDYKTHR
jgi:hypothetical protein